MIGLEEPSPNELALSVNAALSSRSSATLRAVDDSSVRADSVDEEERERWIQEELEQARLEREDFLNMRPPRRPEPKAAEQETTKRRTQSDRETALRLIEQHQESLQYQQEKLSELLENAIKCLHNLEEADVKLQMQQWMIEPPPNETSESDPFEGLEVGSFVHLQLDDDLADPSHGLSFALHVPVPSENAFLDSLVS